MVKMVMVVREGERASIVLSEMPLLKVKRANANGSYEKKNMQEKKLRLGKLDWNEG